MNRSEIPTDTRLRIQQAVLLLLQWIEDIRSNKSGDTSETGEVKGIRKAEHSDGSFTDDNSESDDNV